MSGEKDLNGNWITSPPTPDAYVVIGGDGKQNCVGTLGVKCHTPLTISITSFVFFSLSRFSGLH